jgi:hypothetical protein
MNKLDTSQPGGHPLTLDDFSFLQEANRDSFKGLANILSDPQASGLEPSYIIKGCEKSLLSAGVWQIAAGYVVINGEICFVPQHNVSFNDEADPLFWMIEQSVAPPSPVEYRDLQLQDVHLRRVAKVSTTPGVIQYEAIPTIRALLDRRQRRNSGSFALTNGWQGDVRYTIVHGKIQLHGYIYCSSNAIQSLSAFDIPGALSPWGWGFNHYLGVMPEVPPLIAGSVSVAYGLYGSNSFPSLRLFKSGSTNTSVSYWPCHIIPLNASAIPPRICRFFVFSPQNIPNGSDGVVYNLSGINWDLPAE